MSEKVELLMRASHERKEKKIELHAVCGVIPVLPDPPCLLWAIKICWQTDM